MMPMEMHREIAYMPFIKILEISSYEDLVFKSFSSKHYITSQRVVKSQHLVTEMACLSQTFTRNQNIHFIFVIVRFSKL